MTNEEIAKVYEDGARAAQEWAVSTKEMAEAWRKILESMPDLRERLANA